MAPTTSPSTIPTTGPGYDDASARGEIIDRLGSAVDEIASIVAELDPTRCTADATLRLLHLFSRAGRLVGAGEALVARRADECSAHESTGHRSTAHLVADLGGTTVGHARDAIETAKRLTDCTATDEALRAGDVSVAQAAAVTSAAAVAPDAETDLLARAATESLTALTRRARDLRLAADDDRLGRYRRQCAMRSLRHGRTDDGMVWGHFQLPPDTGAAVVHALERRADVEFRTARSEQRHEGHDRYLADALVALVTTPAAGERAGSSGSPRRSRRPVAEVVVLVSHDALLRGSVDPSPDSGEICMLRGAGPIPVEIARELLDGDAFLKGVLVDGTEVLNVAHFGRAIPAAVRTALEVRAVLAHGDVRCASDGCDRTLGLQWDHEQPFAKGGPTSYENLQPLCAPHHRAKSARDARAGPDP